jgi:hypothetical protein
MSYNYKEYKTVAVLASNIDPGVALNVLGHLALSLGARAPKEMMGRDFLVDKSEVKHHGISKYPVIITKVKQGTVRRAIQEARLNSSILLIDYPKEMLSTGHDDELSVAINNVEEEKIEYLGALLFGKSVDVDKITGRFMLWS